MEMILFLALAWLAGGLWFVWQARDGTVMQNVMLMLLWPVHLAVAMRGDR